MTSGGSSKRSIIGMSQQLTSLHYGRSRGWADFSVQSWTRKELFSLALLSFLRIIFSVALVVLCFLNLLWSSIYVCEGWCRKSTDTVHPSRTWSLWRAVRPFKFNLADSGWLLRSRFLKFTDSFAVFSSLVESKSLCRTVIRSICSSSFNLMSRGIWVGARARISLRGLASRLNCAAETSTWLNDGTIACTVKSQGAVSSTTSHLASVRVNLWDGLSFLLWLLLVAFDCVRKAFHSLRSSGGW